MTEGGGEQMLWNYVDEEGDELLLELARRVQDDGFAQLVMSEHASVEAVMLKILSSAMVKTLAIMCEKMSHPNLAMAYMQVVPMHVDLVKMYVLKELQGSVKL